jgi:hypothetical protein
MKSRDVKPRPINVRRGLYKHYKGAIYEVHGLSVRESTGEWEVLYRSVKTGIPFHRPVGEWFEQVAGGGQAKQQRFTLISAAGANA